MIEVEAPDGTILEFPEGTSREVMLQAMRKKYGAPEPTERGMLWPVSKDAEGNLQFDSDAGILGAAKRAFWLPYEAATGQVQMTDPETGRTSDEAIGRSLEAGAFMSPANPAVRAGDRLVSGAAKSLKKVEPKAPTADELLKAGSEGFDAMRQTGAEYPAAAVKQMAEEAMIKLNQDGIDATVAPKTFRTLSRLADPPEGSVATISNLHSARKNFGKIGGNFNEPVEQEASRIAQTGLDEFIRGSAYLGVSPRTKAAASGSGALGQTPQGAARERSAALLSDANANYAAGKRSDLTQGIERAADLRAAAANSGQNTGNAIRQRVASALLKEKDTAGFSPAEKANLEGIVRGSKPANITRDLGNRLGGGGGLGSMVSGGVGGAAGAFFGGPGGAFLGAAIPVATGSAMKGTSNWLTKRALKETDELIRKRSPLFQQRQANAPFTADRDVMSEAVIRALIMSSPQAQTP